MATNVATMPSPRSARRPIPGAIRPWDRLFLRPISCSHCWSHRSVLKAARCQVGLPLCRRSRRGLDCEGRCVGSRRVLLVHKRCPGSVLVESVLAVWGADQHDQVPSTGSRQNRVALKVPFQFRLSLENGLNEFVVRVVCGFRAMPISVPR